MPQPTSFVGLEKATGTHFRNKELLVQALTHRSAARESAAHGNNERLEFLGDAVLEMAATEYLFHISTKPEGELTNWRSALVQGDHLAAVAKEIKLGAYLFMSRGEEAGDGREKPSTLANAMEALIGAIYLDRGYDAAREFCEKFILRNLQGLLAAGKDRDEKSVFQERTQEKLGVTPHYEVIEEEGPDHDKNFTCAVFIGSEKVASGSGNSKQRAEQAAAKAALKVKGWK
ncbi:MAG: putative ribonuclease III [Candidatus Peregrinibacteria bacterium Greene0416_19]|nr:MAG: putative ribonuclease III [Candidatus Peregrinibacteria bacterium Greene0416_19]